MVISILIATSERPGLKLIGEFIQKSRQSINRDLIIEGLSLARTQKEKFGSILNSNDNDINALFKTLEEFLKN